MKELLTGLIPDLAKGASFGRKAPIRVTRRTINRGLIRGQQIGRGDVTNAKGFAIEAACRSVAQLVEHRSPKPGVAGSSPATPAS
jgi:hypothetical protein